MRAIVMAFALVLPVVALGESRAAKAEQKQKILHALDNCDMESRALIDGAEASLPLVCEAIPKRKDKRCLLFVVNTMLSLADRNTIGFTALKRSDGCKPSLYAGLVGDKSDYVAAMAMELLWRAQKWLPDNLLPVYRANLGREDPDARFWAARALLFTEAQKSRTEKESRPPLAAVEVLADLVLLGADDPGVRGSEQPAEEALRQNKRAAEVLLSAERVPARVFPRLMEKEFFPVNCEGLEILSGAARRSVPSDQKIIGPIDSQAAMWHCGDLPKSPLAVLARPGTLVLPDGYSDGGSYLVTSPVRNDSRAFTLIMGCKQSKCDRAFLAKEAGKNFYGESFTEIVDVLELDRGDLRTASLQLDFDRCRRNGRMESGLFAIAQVGAGPELRTIRKAWNVDLAAGKIVAAPTEGVVCSPECPGMACPW